MNKRKILYITLLAAGMLVAGSCSKSWLDVQPKGSIPEEDYYKNADEAMNGLVAVYDVVGWQSSGFVTKVGALNAASDDHYAGGGGPNDVSSLQVWSNYTLTPATGPQDVLWQKGFAGIARANTLLAKLPDVPMDENQKKRFAAEAKFLRAYFYFDLVRFFKAVPLMTDPISTLNEMYDVPQATPQEVYAQIEQDLKDAIAEPNLPDQVPAATEGGRATKGAAHALLGRVYLFEEKWADAVAELQEVNGAMPGQTSAKYGYKLLDNFGDLWSPAHKFNSESVFEINFNSSSAGNWDCVSCTEGNVLGVMVGPRGYRALTDQAPDYISGWSFLVITPDLFNAIHYDPRYRYTVANLDSLEDNGIVEYEKGFMNTGYFLEKFAGRTSTRSTGGGNWELNFGLDMYEIRLADTYLMEAEARVRSGESGLAGTRSYDLLNAVRARVGLAPVSATIDNIMQERRLELAGEGFRWFDLVRTGRASAVLGSRGFVAGKHEYLPIPLLELDNTQIEQTTEWGGTK
ncbi:RagB/SusD family nutrient uptake outer membrane protein [Chitinophaga japonensis]|uniref:SusD-like starch-binding protein associating with outer membrane n=1 Tax=Chitinophaga japonensis TaxID=104662 RepID=A0A562SII9_CHIJA|nr:RagB/SusD family nutrient uptake outer membrane protein [Chitinophaga japonensis]TWI80933.1 SusD-like starch-binding protein associating with outer membrane [Chitinophaga japonensis]